MIRPVAWRGSAVLIAVLLSLVTGILGGVVTSQQTTPSRTKAEGRPPQRTTDDRQASTRSNPPTAATIGPVAQNSQKDQQRESLPDWWMIGLTGLLVVVGGLQVWSVVSQNNIMVTQSSIMNGQLQATQKSADTAADQLRLLYRPIIDIEKLRVTATRRKSADPLTMTISWRIYNAGSVAAKFVWMGTVCRPELAGEGDFETSRTFENVRAPGRGWINRTEINLGSKAEAAYHASGLAIMMQIRVLLEDPWGKAHYQLFTRRILCGGPDDDVRSDPASNMIHDWGKDYSL